MAEHRQNFKAVLEFHFGRYDFGGFTEITTAMSVGAFSVEMPRAMAAGVTDHVWTLDELIA
jgi:hypothetical protein